MKIQLFTKNFSAFKNLLSIMLLLLLSTANGYSQCSYTGLQNPKVEGDNTFCFGNGNTITTGRVNAGQYVVVNVVKGFRYTFSVGNVFTNNGGGFYENLTLFDINNDNLGPLAFVRGTDDNGAILNWTATLSGKIKVQLSKSANCTNDNSNGGALTLKLNNVGNTHDIQSSSGSDKWFGHIYDLSTSQIPPGGATSPKVPSANYPFLTDNYVGFYTTANETIDEGFGGNTACFPVTSAVTNIYTETFAVRYRMRSTKTGYYFLNVSGDDGIRVYIDDVLVLNQWQQQSETNYCGNLIYLNGSSDIVLDYYENTGQNVVKFSLTPFIRDKANIISSKGPLTVCSGAKPKILVGNSYSSTCASQNLVSVIYQWQLSTDNITWNDILGEISQDYDVPVVNTPTNINHYYRRIVKSVGKNDINGGLISNIIVVTTVGSGPLIIGAISGSAEPCVSITNQVYSVDPVTNALNYTWSVPSGWTINSGQGTNSIAVTTSIGGRVGNVSVTASNGCVKDVSQTLAVNVVSTPTANAGGSLPAICQGGSSAAMEGSVGGGAGGGIWTGGAGTWTNANNPSTAIYKAGENEFGVVTLTLTTSGGSCGTTTASKTITVNKPPNVTFTAAPAANVCPNSDITYTTQPGMTNYSWVISGVSGTDYSITSGGTNTSNSLVLKWLTPENKTVTVNYNSGGCTGTTAASASTIVSAPFSINSVSATDSCSSPSVSIITVSSSAVGLPIGSYTVEYRLSYDSYSTVYYAPMNVITGGSGNFNANVSTVNVTSSTMIRVDKLTRGACTSTILNNNVSNVSFKRTTLGKPGVQTGYGGACSIWKAQWSNESADGYYLDVATTNNFVAGTFLSGYNNLQIVGYPSSYDITGLTPGSTYYYRVRSYNYCGTSTSSNVITFKATGTPAPTIGTITQPTCSVPQGSFTINNYNSGNNYFFSPSVFGSGAIRTAPPGEYTVYVTANGCTSTRTSFTINAVPVTPAMPNVDKIGQPTCDVSTGSVLLSNLPDKGWTINPGNITGAGSTTIITGLAPGTYKFTVSNASCSSVATTDVVINSITKTWNGNSWSDGGAAPTTEQAIVINGKYTSTGDLNGCSCIINSGDVIISSGHTLNLQNQLEVNGAATFTLADGAVLLQENKDATNKGKISAERNVKGLRNQPGKAVDYVYWSSPVTGQQTKGPGGFSPGTPNANFFFYNEANDRFYETGDVTFTRGRGYAVRAETIINPATGLSDTNPYNKTYQFTGAPNNGDISRDIARSNDNPAGVVHGYNLVGNPYPSVIDFNELYLGNCKGKDGTDCLIYNTAWFWTNNVYTANQMGSGYGGNNYAIFNGTGGVPATSPYIGGLTPDGMIGVGQAFIVQKKTTGTAPLQFRNSYAEGHKLRVSTPSTFFQKGNGEKNKFSMKLISPSQLVNTQLIGYVTGATDGYEQDFDAEAFGDFSDLFYSVLDNKKMVIQGKDGNFSADDRVTLGAIFFQNGTYTIELGETEGIFSANQYIYLKDKQANIITNLSQNSYTFSASKGNTANRFEIVYKPEMVLSTEGMVNENIFVYKDDNDFVVKANRKNITALEMYDTAGRLMLKLKPNSLKVFISMEKMVNGVYILKIDQNGEMTTKKVIK